jgi:hypothetical protein
MFFECSGQKYRRSGAALRLFDLCNRENRQPIFLLSRPAFLRVKLFSEIMNTLMQKAVTGGYSTLNSGGPEGRSLTAP